VDVDSLQKRVEFSVQGGVHGLGVALSSEIVALSEAERQQVTRVVVQQARGRVPVVINSGGPVAELAVLYSRMAWADDVDALMVRPPTFLPSGPDQVIAYFNAISDAGRLAAEHLLALGHTYLAHISGPMRLQLARERHAGFAHAVEARGIQLGHCVGGDGNWGCEYGYRAMMNLLGCVPRLTGVFAANDRMAIGAMRAIYEAGSRVPDDISVVGLDDIEVAAYQSPPLTTVRQSFTELATRALQLLLEILDGKEPDQPHVVLEPTLIVRQTSAPPRAFSQGVAEGR
jgi:hypothetical protein